MKKFIALILSLTFIIVLSGCGGRGNSNDPDKKFETISFGKYEQDNNTENGKEAIEWIILKKEGNRTLILSKQILDAQQYDPLPDGMTFDQNLKTWETCQLRTWLNTTFINEAFTAEEQKRINEVTIKNPDNPTYNSDGGNDTTDKVFLLSIDEIYEYFTVPTDRLTTATDYAKSKGLYVGNTGNSLWWLRSPGMKNYSAAYIGIGAKTSDAVFPGGSRVDETNTGVRPALWINS